MKLSANTVHAPSEGARSLHGGRASAKTSSKALDTPAPAPAPEPASTPAESTVTLSAKKVPPGLQRVAARLESLGIEGRSPGQSNALSQITRNLQRYVDTQALAPLPAPTAPPTPVPVPAPTPGPVPIPSPATDEAAPAPAAGLDSAIDVGAVQVADAGLAAALPAP